MKLKKLPNLPKGYEYRIGENHHLVIHSIKPCGKCSLGDNLLHNDCEEYLATVYENLDCLERNHTYHHNQYYHYVLTNKRIYTNKTIISFGAKNNEKQGDK